MGASMFGLFVFGGVYALVTASVKGPVLASSLVMWGVLFALLGWNFMDYGVFNSTSDGLFGGGRSRKWCSGSWRWEGSFPQRPWRSGG
jgi:hypothetical protein